MSKEKRAQNRREAVKKDHPSTVNINERIFAALETDELVPPSWPERPLDRTENGVGTNENDRFSFEEDDF
ncbi:hypothetical protein H8S23_00040 [Anaerofilum sp. BX8]|uniref:Uncharacterized protein n=1 Tax=Anaerofilum hominis TaxID=2763016 RepID=A0A923I6Y1_9FIRM|nr:hypothetical protein [Anaerofilum hominis]MBC5579896.1 hypothetical protein [Anaerofilum hominis]